MHTLPLLGSGPEKAYSGPALLAKGFRPFFFAAALFAGLILPAWSLTLAGRIHVTSYLDPVSWHAHEMLFGFAAAVIAGFLLTAVTNWTERETAVGPRLAVLVALWLAGRVVFAAANHLPGVLVAAIDLAFLPALAFTIGLPIVRSRSKRNVVVVVVVLLLSAANAAMHLDALGLAPGLRRRGALVAVDVVVLLMVLVAGRVVAMFTRNATRDESCRSHPTADRLAVAAVAAVAVLDLLTTGVSLAHVVVPLLASVTVAARAAHWGFRTAMRQPILWILHVGHAWIPIGLALRAMAAGSPSVPHSLGIHAVTTGALGALSLGMMARVALGHTGRSLVLPARFWFAFVAVTIAAAGRLTAPFLAPSRQLNVLVASGVLWALAFVSYAVAFAPILLAPRIDGKAG